VTNILRSLDVPVVAIGFTGDDGHGSELRRGLQETQVNINHMAVFADRFTPTYTKPMLLENGIETELSRMDTKNHLALQYEQEDQIIASLRTVINEVKAILVVDQAKENNCGVITDRIRNELASLAEKYPQKIILADSREYMGLYKNVIVKFNVNEASKMFGIKQPNHSPEFIESLSHQLFEHYRKPIILTLGDAGLQVTDLQGTTRIPAVPITGPTDIVGAGDSVMASIGASLSVGASLIEASIIGCVTASLIIQQIGTTGIATRQQIMERFAEYREWLNSGSQVSFSNSF
jgi:bifunctional ADP-heptose synthase (sugar kinase/adenylyltransferase)